MTSRLDFTIRVPSNIVFHPWTGPAISSSASITSRVQSTWSASSISSPRTQPAGFFDYSLCRRISGIWIEFRDIVTVCVSRIYRCFFGPKIPVYPTINTNLSKETLSKLYWGLGKNHKWRECIDGRYHHLNDKYCFDKGTHQGTVEPGFIGSMEETYTFVEKFLNLKIDADWYLLLHKHTAAHFKGDANGTLMGQEKVGVFRNSDDHIHCHLSAPHYQVTTEGVTEFKALDQALKNEFGLTYGLGEMTFVDPLRLSTKLTYTPMTRDQIRRLFNKFLTEFYQEIASAKTPDEKLWAIAKLQQRLEWLHPVRDGTARTSTALMNKFLTDYGFHPAILEYPHVSSSYGLRQWKEYLQNGLVKWEQERARFNPAPVA